MTNEQLAEFIKQGGADDLKPALWDRVKHLMFKLAGQYYSSYEERFTACGAELADFRQECYPAFIKALEAYSPEKGYAFTSYLEYHIRNAGAELLGIRNADRENNKPLDNCTSLDKPLDTGDSKELCLADIIPDSNSQEGFEQALQTIADEHTREVLHKALGRLDKPLRDVIVLYYFEDMTQEQIAKREGVSGERIRQRKAKALRKLRCMAELRILREEQNIESRLHFDSRTNTRAYFKAQQRISEIIKRGSYLSYGQRQAIIYDCEIEQLAEDNAEYQAMTIFEELVSQQYGGKPLESR
ncbi:sigma-70 family RNA polymerase sigma factor [Ruminococcus bicirculans (ex Wegman et al. 2014)]|uniref:sigma-70 family RNA polymerase sigma factor n=1 Tax=Ruminococcus bicirculans (ex Wegman et al. 2014) TaxID=1160721 RepID=UPI00307CFE5D